MEGSGSGVEILRDSKHGSAFVVNLQKFYDEKTLCDVTLTSSDGVNLEAHWLVLSAHSEFLRHLAVNRDMMQFTMTDSGSLKLNIEATILKTVVDYLYSGDLLVTRQSIDKIKKAAKCLQLARVLEMLDQSHLSPQTSPFPAPPKQAPATPLKQAPATPPKQAPVTPRSTFAPQTNVSPYKQSQSSNSSCQRSDQPITSPQPDRVYLPVQESPVREKSGISAEGNTELNRPSSDNSIKTPAKSRDTWAPAILCAASLFGDKSWDNSSNQLNLETSKEEPAAVGNQPEKVKTSESHPQKAVDTNCTIQFDSSGDAEAVTDHVVCPSSPRLVHDLKMQSIIVDTLTVSRKRGRPSASMSVPSVVRSFEQVPEYLGGSSGDQASNTVTVDLTEETIKVTTNHVQQPNENEDYDDDVYVEINSSSDDSCDSVDNEIKGKEQKEYQQTKRRRYGLDHFSGNGSNQIAKNVSKKYSDLRYAQGSLIDCILCNKPYKNFSRLKAHFSMNHGNVKTLEKDLHFRYVNARSVRPIVRQSLRQGSISDMTSRTRRLSTEPGTGNLGDMTTAEQGIPERHVIDSEMKDSQSQQHSETVGAMSENSSQQPALEDAEPLDTIPASQDLNSSLSVNLAPKLRKKRRRKRFCLSKQKNYAWKKQQKLWAANDMEDTWPSANTTITSPEVSSGTAYAAPVADLFDNSLNQHSFQEVYSSPQHFIDNCTNSNPSLTEDVQPQKATFKCHICGNPYQSRYTLVRHIAEKHRRSSHSTLLYKKKRPSFKKRKTFISKKPDTRAGKNLVPGISQKIIFLNGKPSCPICKKSFTQRPTVYRHIRGVHTNIWTQHNTGRNTGFGLNVSTLNRTPLGSGEEIDSREVNRQEVAEDEEHNGSMEDMFEHKINNEQIPGHEDVNNVRMSFQRPQSIGFHFREKQVPSNEEVRQQFEISREASSCNLCEKTFSHHTTLLQHVRGIHMNLTNYKCVCGKGFVWSSSLSTHKKTCPVYNQRNSLP